MSPGIRVVALAVFLVGDRILVARGVDPVSGEAFHRPLGGGVEFGETAAVAVRREMMEELSASIDEPTQLGVLENVFEYAGRPGHEIVFVFDARFSDAALYEQSELPVTETGSGWRAARWMSLERLAAGPEPLYPDGLLSLLRGHIAQAADATTATAHDAQ